MSFVTNCKNCHRNFLYRGIFPELILMCYYVHTLLVKSADILVSLPVQQTQEKYAPSPTPHRVRTIGLKV